MLQSWVGCAALPLNAPAEEALKDDGSHLQMVSPKDGKTVGQTFDRKDDLHGTHAHHPHVYLDG